jgi:transposase
MSHYSVGCDAHRRYSQFAVLDQDGQLRQQTRVDHELGAIQAFLESLPEGTPVALETVGNWYWIADEIEAAGCLPLLTHAAKAKVMMGNVNKTDKLDAKGLAKLLHLDSLPTVWLPPGEIRDERELHRTRMALSKLRTALKNRIHATLAKYGITSTEHSDIFAGAGKVWLKTTLSRLPPETGRCVAQEIEALDGLQLQIAQLEERIRERVALTPSIQLLKTLPGVGNILAIVIEREIGSIDRFATPGQLASYAGLVPTVHASGGKTRFGHMRKPSNQYLKWAFIEAANVVVRHRHHPAWKTKYVCQVYDQVCQRKGHPIAVGAVARHLAEAAFWILTRQQPYRPPASRQAFPKQVQGRAELVPSEVRELIA